MNNVIFVIALASISITACNNSPKSASSPSEVQGTKEETLYACQMHPEVKGKKGDKCSKCGMDLTVPVEATEHDHDDAHDHHGNDSKDASNQDEMKDEKTDSTMGSKQASYTLSSVYDDYFSLTEALAKDDGKLAQKAAKLLFSNIANVDANKMSSDEKATWTKYKTKLSFDAEHIKSVDENEHQREHFVSLSKNMYEVMKVIKNDKTVYYQHCPMENDNKGANWLSLNSKVSNPYMGKAMPTCGKTVEIIKY
ncbi:MAG: DUF3347 domain-containing protein [Sediminibacterium sp.]